MHHVSGTRAHFSVPVTWHRFVKQINKRDVIAISESLQGLNDNISIRSCPAHSPKYHTQARSLISHQKAFSPWVQNDPQNVIICLGQANLLRSGFPASSFRRYVGFQLPSKIPSSRSLPQRRQGCCYMHNRSGSIHTTRRVLLKVLSMSDCLATVSWFEKNIEWIPVMWSWRILETQRSHTVQLPQAYPSGNSR